MNLAHRSARDGLACFITLLNLFQKNLHFFNIIIFNYKRIKKGRRYGWSVRFTCGGMMVLLWWEVWLENENYFIKIIINGSDWAERGSTRVSSGWGKGTTSCCILISGLSSRPHWEYWLFLAKIGLPWDAGTDSRAELGERGLAGAGERGRSDAGVVPVEWRWWRRQFARFFMFCGGVGGRIHPPDEQLIPLRSGGLLYF